MLETDAEIIAFSKEIEMALSEHNGGPWKEFLCEVHSQFNEMVFWVLLYEDSDLKKTHKVFCDILAPRVDSMKPFQASLDYFKFIDEGLFCVESLGGRRDGNEAVLDALNDDNLGASGFPMQDTDNIFGWTDSKR